jgi:amidase
LEHAPRPDDCWAPGSLVLPATSSGPLTGVTLAVKDMLAIEGHVSSFGHARWRDTHLPWKYTAPVLVRLLAAGASVAGLAKLDQLAWSIIGNVGEGVPPLNSAYPDRFTCGSSSGPAAAVAAGLADIGIGTDTGGSVRAPAAACGLYGLRPTHGLVSAEGVLPLAPSFDTVGVLARELDLLGSALGAMTNVRAADRAVRVVLPAGLPSRVGQATAGAARAVAARLAEGAGCELAEEDLAGQFNDDVADLFARVQARQVWTVHGPWLAANSEALAPDVAGRARRGQELSAVPDEERTADERAWQEYTDALAERLPAGTVVVLPVLPDLPPLRTASADELRDFRLGAFVYTTPASLSGRPELVIPIQHLATGKRLGIGILGAAGADAELIRLARVTCPPQGALVL